VLVLLALAACDRPPIAVHATDDVSETRSEIDHYVAAERTPAAFATLATTLESTRGDDDLAADAELRLLALAQPLAETARHGAIDDEIDALALTVWPALLADPLTRAAAQDLAPHPGETTTSYVARLCDGVLFAACGGLAPEHQLIAVRAVAMRRGSERMHAALMTCTRCGLASESGWREIGWKWESLARGATRDFMELPARPHQAAFARRGHR
jgi:hypothetical protein